MCLLLEGVHVAYLNHRAGIDLDHLPGIGGQLNAQAGAQGATDHYHKVELPVLDELPEWHPIRLVEEHHVGTEGLLALCTLVLDFQWTVGRVVHIAASHQIGHAVDGVVLVLLVSGLEVEIVDILGHQH